MSATIQDHPAAQDRRLITVASGKGGVGKTWFAVTLAHILATRGADILLFDGDLGLANIDIQLGLMPAIDLADAMTGKTALHDARTQYLDAAGRRVFDVLAGKSGSGALQALEREQVMRLRQELIQLAGRYDHVILDLAAGVDETVLSLSKHKGTIITVMTPDPTSLTDAYAFIKLTRQRSPNANIQIVVNNAGSRQEGEKAFATITKACENFLQFRPGLMGIVRNDPKVADAIRAQLPMTVRHPKSDAGSDMVAIARLIESQAAHAA